MSIQPISHDKRLQASMNASRDVAIALSARSPVDQAVFKQMCRRHMQPDIRHGLFINITASPGSDTDVVPYEDFVSLLAETGEVAVNSEPYWAYGVRFSAPGYLDSTEWATYSTPDECLQHLFDEDAARGDEEE